MGLLATPKVLSQLTGSSWLVSQSTWKIRSILKSKYLDLFTGLSKLPKIQLFKQCELNSQKTSSSKGFTTISAVCQLMSRIELNFRILRRLKDGIYPLWKTSRLALGNCVLGRVLWDVDAFNPLTMSVLTGECKRWSFNAVSVSVKRLNSFICCNL